MHSTQSGAARQPGAHSRLECAPRTSRCSFGSTHRPRTAVIALSIWLACSPRASALNPAVDINQYGHSAWTVREGITNVIRHSGARRCTVLLGEHEVEIRDDGRGQESPGSGHGLTGLRERAAALGGTVVTQSLQPGFSLKVVVP